MAEDEGNVLLFAEVGDPVPREQALDADDQSIAKGSDSAQEGFRPAR